MESVGAGVVSKLLNLGLAGNQKWKKNNFQVTCRRLIILKKNLGHKDYKQLTCRLTGVTYTQKLSQLVLTLLNLASVWCARPEMIP